MADVLAHRERLRSLSDLAGLIRTAGRGGAATLAAGVGAAEGKEGLEAHRQADAAAGHAKDPKQNGGKTLAELVHHVSSDPLVLWAWSPGYLRAPVPVPHAEFTRALKAWTSPSNAVTTKLSPRNTAANSESACLMF